MIKLIETVIEARHENAFKNKKKKILKKKKMKITKINTELEVKEKSPSIKK